MVKGCTTDGGGVAVQANDASLPVMSDLSPDEDNDECIYDIDLEKGNIL